MTIRGGRVARAALAVALLPQAIGGGRSKTEDRFRNRGRAGQQVEGNAVAAFPPRPIRVARRDLLSVLQPGSAFKLDNSGNVVGMTFVTRPYWTYLRYVCREDRITVRCESSSSPAWSNRCRVSTGLSYRAIAGSKLSAENPFTYPMTLCDAQHPGAAASWFAAPPSDFGPVRAANMFRMAEDAVKAGRLTPGPCDPHGPDTCRQWVLSPGRPVEDRGRQAPRSNRRAATPVTSSRSARSN